MLLFRNSSIALERLMYVKQVNSHNKHETSNIFDEDRLPLYNCTILSLLSYISIVIIRLTDVMVIGLIDPFSTGYTLLCG